MNSEKKNRYEKIAPALAFILIAFTVLALILGAMSRNDSSNDAQGPTQIIYASEPMTSENSEDVRTITVSGSSELNVMADRVRFFITVTGEDETIQGAGEKTINALDELMKQLEILGFEDNSMQTSSISLSKGRHYLQDNTYEEYHVGQFSIQATLPATTNNSRLVNIFSTVSQIEGAELTGMTFYANNPKEIEKEAYYAAVQDAYGKAEKILEATGEEGVLRVKSVSSSSYSVSPMRSNAVMLASDSANTYLPGANESISASVNVTFTFCKTG